MLPSLHASPRKSPILLLGAVAAVAAALTGVFAFRSFPPGMPTKATEPAAAGVRAPAAAAAVEPCVACGVVETVRAVPVRGSGESAAAGPRTAYRITVRMEDGSYRTLSQPEQPALAAGDRVRVTGGAVVRRDAEADPRPRSAP